MHDIPVRVRSRATIDHEPYVTDRLVRLSAPIQAVDLSDELRVLPSCSLAPPCFGPFSLVNNPELSVFPVSLLDRSRMVTNS